MHTIDKKLTFQCGLKHLGDGNFFIKLGTKYLKSINKELGVMIYFEIEEDPNAFSVEMPEILEVLLEQDQELKIIFNGLTSGKMRNVIHSMNKIKNIDKQIQRAIQIINDSNNPRLRRQL